MEKDLISVIIPIYNIEDYLSRCINSVLKQTYSNLEIILIDDGSTDNSSKICDDFALKDQRIKVVHKQNQGLPEARNTGLKNAIGEYIGFVDGDDYIELDMYEKLYHALKDSHADISACGFIKENGQNIKYDNYGNRTISGQQALEEVVLFNQAGSNSVSNKLYTKAIIKEFRYLPGYLFEDIISTYRLYDKAEKIVFVNEALYHYMIRQGSITTQNWLEKQNLKLETLFDRACDLEKRHIALANMEYNKVTNMAIENCVRLYKKNKTNDKMYCDSFTIGSKSYLKTKDNHSISFLRRTFYFIFYTHSSVFYKLQLYRVVK